MRISDWSSDVCSSDLFAPLFTRQAFVSVDCSPESAEGRGAYNAAMVDDDRFIAVPATRRAPAEATGLDSGCPDLVLPPNLLHPVRDPARLSAELPRLIPPGGCGSLFAQLVRPLPTQPHP